MIGVLLEAARSTHAGVAVMLDMVFGGVIRMTRCEL
jgi:hypothetical protein